MSTVTCDCTTLKRILFSLYRQKMCHTKEQDGNSSESDEDFVVAKPPATAAARIMKKSVAACKVIEYIQ